MESVRGALGIVAITRALVFILTLVNVVTVSRLLTPEEIGLFSVSVAVIGFAHIFRDFGVGQYLMQVNNVTRERRRAAFTITLAFSWAMALVLSVAAPFLASFYRNAGVRDVLNLLAINFIILPFGAPLRTLLQREMQFGKLAVVNLSNHAVLTGVTVVAAWSGASYMSMAWGSIAGTLANVLVLALISPGRALDWPTLRGLPEVLRFGSKASVNSLASEAGGAAPDMILARTLGFSDVAFYSRANGLVSMAIGQLMYIVGSVYTPIFAKGFREGKDCTLMYSQAIGMLLGLTLPAYGMLALLSPYLIEFLFGTQWARSAPLGSVMCAFAMVTAPFALASISLVASGHIGLLMRCRVLIEITRIFALLVSFAYSLEVVVATMSLVRLTEVMLFNHALRSTIGLSAATMWSTVRKSFALVPVTLLLPTALMVATRYMGPIPVPGMLVGCVVLGLIGWVIGITVLSHPVLAEVRRFTRLAIKKVSSLLGKNRE